MGKNVHFYVLGWLLQDSSSIFRGKRNPPRTKTKTPNIPHLHHRQLNVPFYCSSCWHITHHAIENQSHKFTHVIVCSQPGVSLLFVQMLFLLQVLSGDVILKNTFENVFWTICWARMSQASPGDWFDAVLLFQSISGFSATLTTLCTDCNYLLNYHI